MRQLYLSFILWLLVAVSALAVVYTSHVCRQSFAELTQLQQVENDLQVAWGQYLLEQSSLASLTRIEKRGIAELGMRVPDIDEVAMVQP